MEDTTTRPQRIVAVGGLVAVAAAGPVAVWTFGPSALPWVVGTIVAVVLLLVASWVGRRRWAKRFPVMALDLADPSVPVARIEDAKNRLAANDYAAFSVRALRTGDGADAEGQIWFHAAAQGRISKTDIELAYDSAEAPDGDAALAGLIGAGFSISSWEPDHWVLLTRPGDLAAEVALRHTVGAISRLFEVAPTVRWVVQAYA